MRKRKDRFFEVLLLLIALVYCTPYLCRGIFIAPVIVIVWGFILSNISYLSQRPFSKLLFGVCLFIIIILGYRFVGFSDAAWGNYMNQLAFYSCILLMPLFYKGIRFSKLSLWLIWTIIAINVLSNIWLSILYPSINYARLYVDEDFLQNINAGGPSFYMMVLFVFNICYFIFLNCKRKLLRIIMLISCILSAIYILGFCYKGITVLCFFMSVIMIFYARHSKNTSKFIALTLSGIILAFLIVSRFSDEIVALIKALSPHERLTARLVGLVDNSDIDAGTHSAESRIDLYLLSIKTWLSDLTNFIYGIGDHRVKFGAAESGISQHSDLFDILPIYGSMGLVFIWIILKNAFKVILSFFDYYYRLQVGTIILIFIIYGFVEKIFYPMGGCVIFLLLPLSSSLVNKKS